MTTPALRPWLGGALAAFALGCSSSSPGGFQTGDASAPFDGGTGKVGGGGGQTGDGLSGRLTAPEASPDVAVAEGDCPASAKLVYVTGVGNELYSFYPPTLKFTLIGTFNCLDGPTHMTVDRTGTAWVVANGDLYQASTANASCSAVATWKPSLAFPDFALTFIGTTNGPDDSLYILSQDTSALGVFNVSAGGITTVGTVGVASPLGDMTSNGDGTLYFLEDAAPLFLYELNPTNAGIIKSYGIDAQGGGDQALAFYGGSFYAFENNTIYQYDPVAKTTTPRGMAPLSVTGAGQSTCVPTTPVMPH